MGDHRLSFHQQQQLLKAIKGSTAEQSRAEDASGGALDYASTKDGFKYLIHCDSYRRRYWDIFIIFLVLWNVFIIPLQAAFWVSEDYTLSWTVVEHFIDLIFVLDIVANFLTTFVDDESNEVCNLRDIRQHYFYGWFAIDFIAALPFELLLSPFFKGDTLSFRALTVLKCFRLVRLGKMMKYLDYFLHANVSRLFYLIMTVFFLAHWTACAWWLLNTSEEAYFGLPTWAYEKEVHTLKTYGDKYSIILYSVFLMLFRNMDTPPQTQTEAWFAIIVIIVGAVMYATIFGSIAVVIANFDAGQSTFHTKKLAISDRMRFLRLPPNVRERVMRYYDCLWTIQRSVEGNANDFISELSPSLQAEVLSALHKSTIEKVPFFNEFDPVIVNAIVLKLKTMVYLDGPVKTDYIIREGDFGDWMGFITRGACRVVSEDQAVDVVLSESHYFGEMSLLFNTRRTASVMALVYCVITKLSSQDFVEIKSKYPEHGAAIQATLEQYFYGDDPDSDDDYGGEAEELTTVNPRDIKKAPSDSSTRS